MREERSSVLQNSVVSAGAWLQGGRGFCTVVCTVCAPARMHQRSRDGEGNLRQTAGRVVPACLHDAFPGEEVLGITGFTQHPPEPRTEPSACSPPPRRRAAPSVPLSVGPSSRPLPGRLATADRPEVLREAQGRAVRRRGSLQGSGEGIISSTEAGCWESFTRWRPIAHGNALAVLLFMGRPLSRGSESCFCVSCVNVVHKTQPVFKRGSGLCWGLSLSNPHFLIISIEA